MEKNRKGLLVGIIGALVVLAAVLALVLTQCVGGQVAEPAETTAAVAFQEESYELYWNLDRKEYDGKSEAGMSSRKQEADGYFHVRFFKDGEILELKVADRKVVNAIDTNDLMGLTFDEEGIVTGMIRADRMPLERLGWQFYVQSTGGNLIKLNSSRSFNGLEVLLEVEDYTAIYDMTGLEGEVGRKVDMPSESDRVIAIADRQGRVTHVFVTDRSEFMFTVEAECQHCKETVVWKEFTKTNEFPSMSGHYILKNDIKLKGSQVQLPEDASICVDLNGVTVSKTDGGRMIALFNPGVKLAIMDSSEDQSGTILVSGTGDQGLGIWLRYGEFHFYGGTIDATVANTRSGGAAVALDANTFMYMHGGTIRGGNAKTEYNEETNSYSRGMGGAVLVAGKFVMNDGLIEGGKAIPIPGYNAKGQPVNNRGYGGNLLARGNAVVELNGGIIRGGYAGSAGGNLYIDGSAELLLNGTQIQGGYVDGRGCNGGSIYVGAKASVTMTAGSVTGGYCFNEGGNIYCQGTFNMQGGYIGGGTVYTYGTGTVKESCSSQNLFLVSGTLNHFGGTIAGGVHAIDAISTRDCTVVLAGSPIIDGGKDCKSNLTLNTSGNGVQVYVTQLSDYARIGVSSVGIFSEKTDQANADNFFSDLGADVIHYQQRLAVGKLGCICGSDSHYGACDGTEQLWLPHTKADTLPLTEGCWYLTQEVQLTGQQSIRGKQNVALDLNGHTVTTADGARAYALFDAEEPITLTLTDSSQEKTGAIKAVGQNVEVEGQCVWIRAAGQTLNLYDVTLDASGAVNLRRGAAIYGNAGTVVNMYAGRVLGGTAQAVYRESSKAVVNGMGGNIYTNGSFNMYGGTISGGKALAAKDEAKGTYTSGAGGNMAVGAKAQLKLLGGTIEGGHADSSGGNIYIDSAKSVLLGGTQILNGTVGNADLKISGAGGNITTTGNMTLEAGSAVTGGTGLYNTNGGNIFVGTTGALTVNGAAVSGGAAERGGNIASFGVLTLKSATVTGGTAGTGGNIFLYGTKSVSTLTGSTVEKGVAAANGGNVHLGADGASLTMESTVLSGGKAASGGNLSVAQKTTAKLISGTVTGGEATNGGNIYAETGTVTMEGITLEKGAATLGGNLCLANGASASLSAGVITGGKAGDGGNVYIYNSAELNIFGGAVEKGFVTKDGAGNIDVRGTLNMHGGTVSGGYRVDSKGNATALSLEKRNIFAYKGVVNISGGTVDGGVMIHTGQTGLNLSKDACIASSEAGSPSLTLNAGALMTLGTLSEKADIAISNGVDTKLALSGGKTALSSDLGLVISAESDGALYLRNHTHCTVCDQLDGVHAENCQGVDEARLLWDGGDITENGTYCLHDEISVEKPAAVSASDVTILVEGKLTSTKRALNIKSGAEVTLKGSGIIEGKGANNENTGVVIVDGKLTIKGVTLQQIADASINVKTGGVLTVGSTGQVTMDDGIIRGGKASNGGGNVFVNGGSFTMNGGTIENGVSGVGGNIFLYNGGSFTMADDGKDTTNSLITGGYATGKNGGNVNIGAGSQFTLECGNVENGYQSGGDGVGNIYVGGTLNISGGTITGGYRVNDDGVTVHTGSRSKRNVFAVDGTVNMSGGLIDGGVTIHNNKASSTLKVSKAAKIESFDQTEPSLSLSNGALLTVDGALDTAAYIVVSNEVNTKLAASGSHAYKDYIASDSGLLVSVEADGMYLRAHTHCSVNCGQLDGTHVENCTGYDVAGWTKWDGGDITAAGSYCLHEDKALAGPATISAGGVTLLVNANLTSDKQALVIASGAEVTLTGSGTVAGKGENGGKGGVVYVNGGKLTVQSLTLQQTADSAITVEYGGVIYVASGSVTLESGTVQSGTASYGGNIYVAGGSVVQSGALVTGGSAKAQASAATKAQGGNICIASGATYTLKSGTIQNGSMAALDGAGNIDVRGTFVMEGGTVTGGYRAAGGNIDLKNNIFAVNSTVQLSGGQIDGGVMIFSTAADRAQLQVSKDAKIVANSAGKGLTLYQSKVIADTASLTSNALVKLTGTDNKGNLTADVVIAQSKDDVAMTHSVKSLFGADAGGLIAVGTASYRLTLEEDNKLYVRAADAHVHCLCGRTDGTHAEGCGGWDVVYTATTSLPKTSGNYYLNAQSVTANEVQLGSSDGSANVSINLCLAGKELTNDAGKARIALIWGGSSLTVTDCGSGTIKSNATTGNGGIFHPAKNSNLTIYNGTLDASTVSSAKPGVAIDNAGTTKIYGGQVLGGNATATDGNGAGGAIRNTGTLLIAGGTVSGGKAAYRGGNIYSENGSVTISGGYVLNGWVCADSSNIDVRNGSLTISGGTISGGNRYTNNTYTAVHASGEAKRNIFTLNATVVISGGQIDGGVQLFKTSAGSVTVSGDPKIVSSEAGKKNLSTSYQLVIGKPGLDKTAQIVVTSAPAGALAVAESGLTLTDEMAACFTNDSGVAATLENNQILFK